MFAKDPSVRQLARWLAAALAAASAFVAAPSQGADAIPAATFFSNAAIRDVRISPSGRHLALTVPATNGRMVLAVVEVGSDKPPTVVAASSRFDIYSFQWVNDDRLVYEVADLQVVAVAVRGDTRQTAHQVVVAVLRQQAHGEGMRVG